MTDLNIAKNNLSGHTLCLCKEGHCLYSDLRGIAPIMQLMAHSTDLRGYSAADTVVGKAAAMLFARCGIASVYAKTLSESARRVLLKHGIPHSYEQLAPQIRNRAGTDMCPMEKAVQHTDNLDEAYILLQRQMQLLHTTA